MTDQELIKALGRIKVETGSLACWGCGHEHNCGIHGCAIMRAAADRLEELERKVPRWIPVTERLPDNDNVVLCWYEYFRFGEYNQMYRTFGIGYYLNGMWGGEVSNGRNTKVLAWMSLPEGPEDTHG